MRKEPNKFLNFEQKVFLDTGFVIALLLEKDENHLKAKEIFFEITKGNVKIILHDGILLEIGNAFAKLNRQIISSYIRKLLASKNVEVVRIDLPLLLEAIKFYEKFSDKRWGLVDCISFVVMNKFNLVQALAFDKDFEEANFVALGRVI